MGVYFPVRVPLSLNNERWRIPDTTEIPAISLTGNSHYSILLWQIWSKMGTSIDGAALGESVSLFCFAQLPAPAGILLFCCHDVSWLYWVFCYFQKGSNKLRLSQGNTRGKHKAKHSQNHSQWPYICPPSHLSPQCQHCFMSNQTAISLLLFIGLSFSWEANNLHCSSGLKS